MFVVSTEGRKEVHTVETKRRITKSAPIGAQEIMTDRPTDTWTVIGTFEVTFPTSQKRRKERREKQFLVEMLWIK